MKRTKEYWKRRSEQELLDLLSQVGPVVKQLDRFYFEASDSIANDIEALYGRFMDDNGLDKDRAFELIQGDEYRRWRMSMEEYMREIKAGDDEALLLELNTLAMRARINRLEALQADIYLHSAMLASKEEELVGSFLSKGYKDSYYRSMYEEYKANNPYVFELIDKHKVRVSKDQVEKVLSLPWSGENYSQIIWKNSYYIAKKTQALVVKNILAGTSLSRLSRELEATYGRSYRSNIMRLLRTETAYVKGQADLEFYKRLEVDEYEILATLDTRTSPICQSMDGKHFPTDKAVEGVNYPPFHPNCRTTTIKYVKDYGSKTRMAKDARGKNVLVPLGMKYKDWLRWVGADNG